MQDGLPHSDIYGSSPLADPRSFSQLVTSFFASESLGIPRAPLFTYIYRIPPLASVYNLSSLQDIILPLNSLLNMSMNSCTL